MPLPRRPVFDRHLHPVVRTARRFGLSGRDADSELEDLGQEAGGVSETTLHTAFILPSD